MTGIALLIILALAATDGTEAVDSFRKGQFEEAARLFEAALQDADRPRGPVLFNLGNCHYRMGRPAQALYYYHRALLHLPRDARIRFNMGLAEEQLGLWDRQDESFYKSSLELVDALSPGLLLIWVGVLQCVGLTGWVLFRRRPWVRNASILIVLIALTGAARRVQTQWFAPHATGVVLAREAAVHREPHDRAEVLHKLGAGDTVQVEAGSDRWIRIDHVKGEGWIDRGSVGVVQK
jgi:tetratricopeptide (TPR) repeat protein